MTTRINLRDWRRERRELRKKQFAQMMGLGAIAAIAVVGISWLVMSGAVDNQQARNQRLQAEIKEMDQKIKEIEDLEKVKSNLLARMRVIEDLQANRAATVHFFDEIVSTLPEGVNLTSLKQAGGSVTIDGIADSNGRISTYMKNLDASPWFADPRLIVITTNDKSSGNKSKFTLSVKVLKRPSEKNADDDEGTDP
ncbi:PilN domain-containing protein [Solimonas terrae]|uniref:PilN domain-containing protein n=1 Tax=Solimonas terrae TaxID=1396819 RepID=A0A6M2BVI3_9GAMM|nr:PilN domain-containing protein [Solimonas terrae]NGY06498.1 PilN domain-containing protein [Solimonas terrae]